ncbi:MAG: type VI secretion system tip protein VgrG [Chitinispirillales bacterium]|nr:type VI secretion system tip protein VgrG [Chitinispirillales bacterium]
MANSAKFFISIAGFEPSDFIVTKFSGEDAISAPYCFDIEFQASKSTQTQQMPTAEIVLGKPCRFELIRDDSGEVTAYHGIIKEFNVHHRSKSVYAIQIVPRLQLLSLNINNRVFQKLPVIDIVKKVIQDAELERYCNFRYELEQIYQPITFCVQYQETDLNFISRLLECNGIWYYFDSDNEAKKDTVVITDAFSKFPTELTKIPFMEAAGFSETSKNIDETGDGDGKYGIGFGESIYSLTSKASLYSKSVKLRSQNYRTPERVPEGIYETRAKSGVWGSVYEYGGAFKNTDEATRLAALYMKRLQVENLRTEGKSGCKALRAGRLISVEPDMGDFLLTSVTHRGGVKGSDDNHEYTYDNSFNCIDISTRTYAPPLRAIMPRIDGLMTAQVEALGESYPTLNEIGSYRVKLPFDNGNTAAYGASKDIRLAQPSGGENYGMHFSSKAGAEMAVGFINGNPDKPLGVGFVPNANAPSIVNCLNKNLNIMRSYGGNEFAMDDTPGEEIICISTPDKAAEGSDSSCSSSSPSGLREVARQGYQHLKTARDIKTVIKNIKEEISDIKKIGEKLRIINKNCALMLDNKIPLATLRVREHQIFVCCNEIDSSIALVTGGGNVVLLDDTEKQLKLMTRGGCSINMKDNTNAIIISNTRLDFQTANHILLDGRNKKIVIKTGDGCAIEMIDDKNGIVKMTTKDGCMMEMNNTKDSIILMNADKTNKVTLDGKGKKINMDSEGDININAKGSISITSGKTFDIKSEEKFNIQAKDNIIIKSEKRAAVKGKKGGVNITTSSAKANLLLQAKKGNVTNKGKAVKVN